MRCRSGATATISAGAGEPADGPLLEYPVVLRGEAPEHREDVSIEGLGTGADLMEVLRRYRFGGRETADFIRGRVAQGGRWWLVVPPYQPTGGHRLRVAFDGGSARACLARPRGPATMALEKNAWLVALPCPATPAARSGGNATGSDPNLPQRLSPPPRRPYGGTIPPIRGRVTMHRCFRE